MLCCSSWTDLEGKSNFERPFEADHLSTDLGEMIKRVKLMTDVSSYLSRSLSLASLLIQVVSINLIGADDTLHTQNVPNAIN